MLDQRRRRWVDVVQMLYKCVVLFAESYDHECVNTMFCTFNIDMSDSVE